MITSASNDKIKEIKKLMKSASKRREMGVYIVEGIRMVREIPKDALQAVYVAESMEEAFRPVTENFHVPVELVRDSVFQSMSDTNTPQGILALVRIPQMAEASLYTEGTVPFMLIVERLQDPGNLGTIIRTAEGAGVTGIILSADSVDLYNPKVVRSTMGSIFRVPVYVTQDLTRTIADVKAHGIRIYGAHLSGTDFYEEDFTGGCAFLIGNEGNGLTEQVSASADALIRIPMQGQVESLNAAISTAVISYEVLRQRLAKK